MAGLFYMALASAQTEGVDTTARPERDTIRVGNMIIIRSGRDRNITRFDTATKTFRPKREKVKTNWFVADLGFSQISDKTSYPGAIADGHLPSGASNEWFDQRNIKSTNVNIWLFIQRLSLVEHVVNLKYGVGVELNNYRYREPIRFQETNMPLVIMETADYKKNKLAADYITVPLMINFNSTPKKKDGFGFSVGISAGYLYSSRQKIVGGGLGKKKFRDDYDLRPLKLSYIGELNLGFIRLYGSMAAQSMFENTLDQTPWNVGLRFSHL